jgi:antitoxin (DNA-binding transcriptional repressor) of toxin-antitoxin stability system
VATLESMRVVGIKLLKNKLSEYVRIAASGERVLVTDRDRVVAELGPPREGTSENAPDALLAEAVRNGWLRPPMIRMNAPPPSLPVMSFDDVMRALDESREERF